VAVRWVTRCGIIIAGIDVAGLTKVSASEKSGVGDVLGRLEFPCSSCAGIALATGAMVRTRGTSSGDVRRLDTPSSCAFGVVSFQIKTCSFWFALVSVSCSRSLFQSQKSSSSRNRSKVLLHIGTHRSASEYFRFNESYFRAISLRSSFNIRAWSLAIRTSALNWKCAVICACARACHVWQLCRKTAFSMWSRATAFSASAVSFDPLSVSGRVRLGAGVFK
jgi:hypothetical protein